MYIKYKLSYLSETAKIFKYVCIYHIKSAQQRDIISLDEECEMIYNINKIYNKYEKKLDFNSIICMSKEKLKVENLIDEYVEIMKFCDSINYITIQTTAHELEYIGWFLIIEKIKLYNIVSTFFLNRFLHFS